MNENKSEPSPQEILAAIQRVLDEDSDARDEPHRGRLGDVLELTNEVQPDGTTRDLADAAPDDTSSTLLSPEQAATSIAHLARLAGAADGEETPRDMAEITEAIATPVIREWLDANLASIVEQLVEREIRRLVIEAGKKPHS